MATTAFKSETVNTVLFCPDDLNLIKEGAAVRRRLMDNAISQIRPRYAGYLAEFNRLYEHKTRILKDWHEKPSLLETLDEFSDGMCRATAQLIRYRASFVARLNEAAPPIHREFSGEGETLDIKYSTVSTVRDVFASASFASRPYFDAPSVLALFDDYIAHPENHGTLMFWRLLNVELWMRTFFDDAEVSKLM